MTDKEEKDEGCSVMETAGNLAKICLGTGILGLPFAVFNGGVVFSSVGIGVVALWNIVSCAMIFRCKESIRGIPLPAHITSDFSRIAYAGLGRVGVTLTEFCIVVSLLGVSASNQIAVGSLLKDVTFCNQFPAATWIMVSGVLAFPFTLVRDIGVLSSVSIGGLWFLMFAILCLFYFGISQTTTPGAGDTAPIPMMPDSWGEASTLAGVCIYCFGFSAFVMPLQRSMRRPTEAMTAVTFAAVGVWVFYTATCVGLVYLYANAEGGLHSNILENLPTSSVIAQLVRLSMALVCLLTFPVVFIPVADLIESTVVGCFMRPLEDAGAETGAEMVELLSLEEEVSRARSLSQQPSRGRTLSSAGAGGVSVLALDEAVLGYDPLPEEELLASQASSSMEDQSQNPHSYNRSTSFGSNASSGAVRRRSRSTLESLNLPPTMRWLLRAVMVIFTTILAIRIPCFGLVLNLLGSFTLSIMSFVLPPLLHLTLVTQPMVEKQRRGVAEGQYLLSAHTLLDGVNPQLQLTVDYVLLAVGALLTVAATGFAIVSIIDATSNGGASC